MLLGYTRAAPHLVLDSGHQGGLAGVRALERAVTEETGWSEPFLEALEKAGRDRESHGEIQDMVEAIASRRTRKKPPKL